MKPFPWSARAPMIFNKLRPQLGVVDLSENSIGRVDVGEMLDQHVNEREIRALLKGLTLMKRRYPSLSLEECFERLHKACLKELGRAESNDSAQTESFLGLGGLVNATADLLYDQVLHDHPHQMSDRKVMRGQSQEVVKEKWKPRL